MRLPIWIGCPEVAADETVAIETVEAEFIDIHTPREKPQSGPRDPQSQQVGTPTQIVHLAPVCLADQVVGSYWSVQDIDHEGMQPGGDCDKKADDEKIGAHDQNQFQNP